MSIFNKILSKLGLGGEAAKNDTVPHATTEGAAIAAAPPVPVTPEATPTPNVIAPVDVTAKLEALAAANPEKLNWRTSIVDLLKLLGLDSSLAARKELAMELRIPPEKLEDSAQMNIWLHKQVLQKLAENGGNVPAELRN
ncbi:DUF3597 domain-containing protein [Cellvibrio polysaccharolyticus]|uniref:DUF3597 domain-containing protein n=1 Tax=Cellvibrio polysaccharolyticus TaxID=2082724 RepID=A0A928YSP7_9GAMM|nr:DUF3597 domain-containing protein [Cellvibrio polysaccharolyticus]MBE8716636.1 DUF3597 domain-containing protein [Cellvibrio polysaccharolyticus]